MRVWPLTLTVVKPGRVTADKRFALKVEGLPASATGTITFSEGGVGLGEAAIGGRSTPQKLYQAFGDSVAAGAGLTEAWPALPVKLVAAAMGFELNNEAVAGDVACDTFGARILRGGLGPDQIEERPCPRG